MPETTKIDPRFLCTYCGVNWKQLHDYEIGDQQLSVCPECKSDLGLVLSEVYECYVKNPITGKIFNYHTGMELRREIPPPPPVPPADPKKLKAEIEFKQSQKADNPRVSLEDKRIDDYLKSINNV